MSAVGHWDYSMLGKLFRSLFERKSSDAFAALFDIGAATAAQIGRPPP